MVKIRHLGRALLGLVVLFAFSTGAKADVTLPTIGSKYIIHSYNRTGVLTANASNGGVVHDVFVPGSSYWTIESANSSTTVTEGVYLKNGDGYYITSSRGLTTSQDEAGVFYIYSYSGRSTTPAAGLVISTTSGQTDGTSESLSNCFDANNASTDVGTWTNSSSDSQGTTWVFEDVTSVTTYDTYLNYLNPDQTKVYTVTSDRASLYAATGATKVVTTYGMTVDASDEALQFAFIKSDEGNLYMYSVGAKGFVSLTDGSWVITDTPTSTYMRIIPSWTVGDSQSSQYPFVIQGGSSWSCMNMYNWTSGVTTYGTGRYYNTNYTSWSWQGDDGNMVGIDAVSGVTFDATDVVDAINTYETITTTYNALQTVIAEADAITISADGTLYTYADTDNAFATALSAAKAITTDNTAEQIATAKSDLETAIAALTFNVPSKGKFYRIKNTATGVYLAATNANEYAGFDAAEATSNIFYYDENSYLVNYSTGYRVAANKTKLYFGGVNDAVAIDLKAPANGAASCCNICYTGSNRYERLYISGSGTDSDPYWANNLDYTDTNSNFISTNLDNFTLEEVTTIPVTIGTSGFGTLYTPVALTIPSGRSVYTGSLSSDKKAVELSLVEGTIPANTAVLVAGTSGESVEFTTASTSPNPISGILAGQVNSIAYDPTTSTDTYYTLQTINGASGFAKFNGTVLKGFKCYILNPDVDLTESAIALRFPDATGINAINAATENGNATIYDLQGRRVQNAARGLYIVNGQKILVK